MIVRQGVHATTAHRRSTNLCCLLVAMLRSTCLGLQGAAEPAASTPAASDCSTKAAPSCCHSAQQQGAPQHQAGCQPARSSGDCQATPEHSPAVDDGEEVCQIVGSALKQSAAAAAAAGGRLPLGSVHLPIPPLYVEGTQLRGNLADAPQSQSQQQQQQWPCEKLPLTCGDHAAGGAWWFVDVMPAGASFVRCCCMHVCAPGVTVLCWLQERQLPCQKTMKKICCRIPAG